MPFLKNYSKVLSKSESSNKNSELKKGEEVAKKKKKKLAVNSEVSYTHKNIEISFINTELSAQSNLEIADQYYSQRKVGFP